MLSETKRYEKKIRASLQEYFKNLGKKVEVENQWVPFRGEVVSKYSPRVDVAVGPFAYWEEKYIHEYNRLTKVSREFINNLLQSFKANSKKFSFEPHVPVDCEALNNVNENARCFMAIEIEKSGTRKHRLGDIVNACSLGRVGVIIAWDSTALKSFLKIAEYLSFLKSKLKPTYETKNLIVVSKEQFLRCFINQ
jgi:hypothetical protein